MKIASTFLGALLTSATLLLSTSVSAGPAPYYKYQSKVNGYLYCSQTNPGSGWILFSGPYDTYYECRYG